MAVSGRMNTGGTSVLQGSRRTAIQILPAGTGPRLLLLSLFPLFVLLFTTFPLFPPLARLCPSLFTIWTPC